MWRGVVWCEWCAAARRARQLATVLAKETEAIMERDRLREKVQAVERDLARLQALRAAEEAKQALALAEGRPFDEELLTDLRAVSLTWIDSRDASDALDTTWPAVMLGMGAV